MLQKYFQMNLNRFHKLQFIKQQKQLPLEEHFKHLIFCSINSKEKQRKEIK